MIDKIPVGTKLVVKGVEKLWQGNTFSCAIEKIDIYNPHGSSNISGNKAITKAQLTDEQRAELEQITTGPGSPILSGAFTHDPSVLMLKLLGNHKEQFVRFFCRHIEH